MGVSARPAGPELPRRVLIAVANPLTARELVAIGADLLAPGGELTALGIVEVPEGVPLSQGATRARQARRLLQRVLDYVPEGTTLRPLVRIGRRAAEGILEAARELESELIIFGWGGRPPRDGPREGTGSPPVSPTVDEVIRASPCDILVVRQRGYQELRRILVPVRGGPNAELALRLAATIARRHGATVVALHVLPEGITEGVRAQAERALGAFLRQHAEGVVEPRVVEAASVGSAILRRAQEADLVVLGGAVTPTGSPSPFGRLVETIAQRARPTVIVAKSRQPVSRQTFEELARRAETLAAADRAAEAVRAVPGKVERWFAEANFHHTEFADLHRLVALKEQQGLTISLVLPTLNEEATIGPIVRRALRDLVHRLPLVDELLVVDSASTDRTREIAAAEGARVVQHPDILPQYGSFVGKGEALWKSLHETSGDLVVWCDTDVRNWHPRMVYGVLGPLLVEPRLVYVKGYYQRPIVEGGVLKEGGGGRVTELVARPLINLFFPELSGFIQPLAGEYAGRRSILEQIPFFTGYAVEIGHLIDILDRVGLEGMGQVDLERRVHRNQELEGLSRMSFVILQAVMRRLEERRQVRLFAELGSTMKLPRSGRGRLALEVIELADQERPPIVQIPEYVERHRAGRGVGAASGGTHHEAGAVGTEGAAQKANEARRREAVGEADEVPDADVLRMAGEVRTAGEEPGAGPIGPTRASPRR
jgi:glucosyl-3-phosphoglycerate synthase